MDKKKPEDKFQIRIGAVSKERLKIRSFDREWIHTWLVRSEWSELPSLKRSHLGWDLDNKKKEDEGARHSRPKEQLP